MGVARGPSGRSGIWIASLCDPALEVRLGKRAAVGRQTWVRTRTVGRQRSHSRRSRTPGCGSDGSGRSRSRYGNSLRLNHDRPRSGSRHPAAADHRSATRHGPGLPNVAGRSLPARPRSCRGRARSEHEGCRAVESRWARGSRRHATAPLASSTRYRTAAMGALSPCGGFVQLRSKSLSGCQLSPPPATVRSLGCRGPTLSMWIV